MADAAQLLDTLRGHGVTHVVGLPDNGSAALFDRLAEPGPAPELVRVSREAEAFAIAAGLWVGGAHPIVAIQNTGLMEAGDALRGTVLRMGVPLLCLIGYRGYARTFGRSPAGARRPARTPGNLRSTGYDSVALLTEPTLKAWAIPYRIATNRTLCGAVEAGLRQAARAARPVAVLLTEPLA